MIHWKDERRIRPCLDQSQSPLDSLATPLSRPLPDAGGRLIDQRLALAAVFGRPRRHSKKSFAGSQSQRASPIGSLPCHQVRSKSETQLTLAKQVKSARVTIRQTRVGMSSGSQALTRWAFIASNRRGHLRALRTDSEAENIRRWKKAGAPLLTTFGSVWSLTGMIYALEK